VCDNSPLHAVVLCRRDADNIAAESAEDLRAALEQFETIQGDAGG
jgi:hypothetical protein